MRARLVCIALLVSSLGASADLEEIAELVASDGQRYDSFGGAVALSGRSAVISAIQDVLAPGVQGAPPGTNGAQGSAYVFEQNSSGGPWPEIAKRKGSDSVLGDRFGASVAIDGDTIVVGARDDDHPGIHSAGSAFVFARDQGGPNAWGQVGKLLGSNPEIGARFGHATAVSGDTLVVGAYGQNSLAGSDSGVVYVFERNQGGPEAWGQVAELEASDAAASHRFGLSVSLAGDTLMVGAYDWAGGMRGAVYVFDRDLGGTWIETAKLTSSDMQASTGFGASLAGTPDLVVVGSLSGGTAGEGAAHVFERNHGGPNAWGELQALASPDPATDNDFAASVAVYGNRVLVGSPRATPDGVEVGAAYVFDRVGPTFGPGQELKASDPSWRDSFGSGVALSEEVALIGASVGNQGGAFLDGVRGLAYDPLQDRLFGADQDSSLLVELDPSSGAVTAIGALGFPSVEALAFDENTGTLYGASSGAGRALYRIDTTTGAGTKIGDLPGPTHALAFDPLTAKLYGVIPTANTWLAEIDTSTAATILLGTLSAPISGLSFDAGTGLLFGTDRSSGDLLVTIDPATLASVAVGPLGSTWVLGLASGPSAGSLFGTTSVSASNLLSIDSTTGSGTVIGPYSTSTVVDSGTAYLFTSLPTGAVTYCTAGLSASGCQATLAATGVPSASAASGFILSASSVEGSKDGLFYFGVSGRQANAWGNGSSFQCVVPPVTRASLLTGSGTGGLCDGALSQDLNALWCSTCPKPQKNPGPGATVQAQLWYRDPFNTSNQTTTLSNAIEFCLAP